MVSSEHDHLLRKPNFEGEQEADDFTALLASINVVAEEQVLEISAENLVLLVLLILVSHLLEHVQQITILAVDVSENLDGRLELKERLLFLENAGDLLEQEADDLLGQVYEWHVLGVLPLVVHNFVVQVVNNHVHDEVAFIHHVRLRNLLDGFIKLLAPYFLDIEGLGHVLLWLEVPVEKNL